MHRSRRNRPPGLTGAGISGLTGAALLATAAAAWGEPAAPPDDGAGTAPAIARPAADPARTCYQAAESGGRDAYACDLAVQMARDAGDVVALTTALANRSLVLSSAGRLQPALGDVNEAIGLTPAAAGLHGNRGNLLLRLGRASDALTAHDRAIELDPQDPVGYYNRAFSYLALGQPQRADRDLAIARDLAGNRGAGVRGDGIPGARARRGR